MSDTETETTETAEQAAYRAEVQAWFAANATPRRADDPWAVQGFPTDELARAHFDAGAAWQGKLYEAGYAGTAWPAAYGGGGGEVMNATLHMARPTSMRSTTCCIAPHKLRM